MTAAPRSLEPARFLQAPTGQALVGSLFVVWIRLPAPLLAWGVPPTDAALNLSYRWLDVEGSPLVADGLRTPVPSQLQEQGGDLRLLVQAPDHPGRYRLQVSAVYEGRFWWTDRGFPSLEATLTIEPPRKADMAILVAGGAGFGNTGDEVLLRRAVELCLHLAPVRPVVVSTNGPEVSATTLDGLHFGMVSSLRRSLFLNDAHYGVCDAVFLERWAAADAALTGPDLAEQALGAETLAFADRPACAAFLRVLETADRLVIHGGGILTSATRSRLWEMALLARLARRVGVPVALRSHQLGPFTDKRDAALARELVDGAEFVSVRDVESSSLSILKTGAIRRPWELPDDAFRPVARFHRATSLKERYGLQGDGYIVACYRRNSAVGVTERVLECFVGALQHAVRHSGLPIVLLPMGLFDVPTLWEVESRLTPFARVVVPVDWLEDAPAIAQDARFMISVPHHPLIFALQAGTPVISVVEGRYYADKNMGSMRFFGLGSFVVDATLPDAISRLRDLVEAVVEHEQALRTYIHERIVSLFPAQAAGMEAFEHFLSGKTGTSVADRAEQRLPGRALASDSILKNTFRPG